MFTAIGYDAVMNSQNEADIARLLTLVDTLAVNMVSGFARIDATFAEHAVTAATLRADMNRRFDAIDERFDRNDERFDRMDARFDRMDERFDRMDERFDRMDERFDRMDERFDRMDARFDGVDAAIGELGTRVGPLERPKRKRDR